MALYQVAPGSKILAADMNQVIQGLTGLAAQVIILDGDYGSSYAFTVMSRNAANGLIAAFQTPAGTFLNLTKAGMRISNDGINFDKVPVTEDGVETLTHKTMDWNQNTFQNFPSSVPDNSVSTVKLQNDSVTGRKLGIINGIATYSTGQSITAANVDFNLTFDGESWDTDNYHNSSGASERFIDNCPVAGLYRITLSIGWQSLPGDVMLSLKRNGVGVISFPYTPVANVYGGTDFRTFVTEIRLNAGDNLYFLVKKSNPSTQNIANPTYVFAERLGA